MNCNHKSQPAHNNMIKNRTQVQQFVLIHILRERHKTKILEILQSLKNNLCFYKKICKKNINVNKCFTFDQIGAVGILTLLHYLEMLLHIKKHKTFFFNLQCFTVDHIKVPSVL